MKLLKKTQILFVLLFMLGTSDIRSQGDWDIGMTQNGVSCEENRVCYELVLRSSTGTSWTLGDQNYRLFYDGAFMTIFSVTSLLPGDYYSSASIDQNLKYREQGQDTASPLDEIDNHLGFLDFSIIQTDKTDPLGAVSVTSTYSSVAEICVSVPDTLLRSGGGCLSFYHSRPSTAGSFTNQYTTITENDASGSTAQTSGINYDDLTSADGTASCPGNICSSDADWNIRLNRTSANCESNEVCYELELQTDSDTWTLGDQNYRLFYDGDLMTVTSVSSLLPSSHYGAAVINMDDKYTGAAGSSPLDDIDSNLGFLDFGIVQTDKTDPLGAVSVTSTYSSVAEICVSVPDTLLRSGGGCLSFYHSRPSTAGNFTNQYTTITENDASGSTAQTSGINYDDLTSADGTASCPGNICSSDAAWNIRLNRTSANCESNEVCYELELQTDSDTWTLGDQNYRLFYDGDLMTVTSVSSLLPSSHYGSAVINMDDKYTGAAGSSPLDDIDSNLGFLDFGMVQTDKTDPSGAVSVTSTYSSVAEICVSVPDTLLRSGGGCLSFYHSRPSTAGSFTNQYTTITENDASGSTVQTSGINYDDLTSDDGTASCPGNICSSDAAWNISLNRTSSNCESNEVCYELELQTASDTWTLGDQNYRLFYDGDLMTVTSVSSLLPSSHYGSAVINMDDKYTGAESSSPLDEIDSNLGFLDFGIVQTDKTDPAGAVSVTSAYSSVAEICVSVPDTLLRSGGGCLSFYHSRPSTAGNFTNQYTTITENDASGSTAQTSGINYDDLTSHDGAASCPGNICPDCEIMSAGDRALMCNDNGTPFDASDDYVSFILNPTGTGLSAGYTVSFEGSGSVFPQRGNYGEETSFQMPSGSADGTGYSLRLTDEGDSGCTYSYKFSQGSCSSTGQWDIRLRRTTTDCDSLRACYTLEVKNTAGTDWTLGDQNYRLFYDGALMTIRSVTSLLPSTYYGSAVINMDDKYTDIGQEAASPLDDIDGNLGFLDFGIIQADKSNPGAAVRLNSMTYTPTAEICVDLAPAVFRDINNNTCITFYHSRPSTAGSFTNQYTRITENHIPNGTKNSVGANYDDMTWEDGTDACDFTVCHQYDYGDLPDTSSLFNANDYQTSSSNSGASHLIIPGLYLGQTVDGEPDGQPAPNAEGDGADEDGTVIPATADWRLGGIFRLPFEYVNMTGERAYLRAWADWNGDGDFEDPGEWVTNWEEGEASLLEFTIPNGAATNQQLGLRLRLSLEDNLTPYGAASSGEVEDYLIELSCRGGICLPIEITISE